LATFTDPGFDNPANPNAASLPNISDPLHESFTYDVDWGDGRDALSGVSIADIQRRSWHTFERHDCGQPHVCGRRRLSSTVTVHDDNGGVGTSTFW